jgi:hypothetical protein
MSSKANIGKTASRVGSALRVWLPRHWVSATTQSVSHINTVDCGQQPTHFRAVLENLPNWLSAGGQRSVGYTNDGRK